MPTHPPHRQVTWRATFLLCALVLVACDNGISDPQEALESTDPCTTATDITVGQSVEDQLTPGDCVQSDGVYADRWSLTIDRERSIRIDLSSAAFDAFLELRRSGVVVATNDDAGSLDSRIIQNLTAGTYTIVARSLGPGGTGPYQLAVRDGPDCSPVGELSVGQTVTGRLSPDDCLFEWGGIMDNWTLRLTDPQKLRMDLKSPDFDEFLLLRDQQGNVMQVADPYGPAGHARIEVVLERGTWTISPTSPQENADGGYELTVDVAPPCTPGTELVLGETESGMITSDDCLLDGWAPADSFALVLAEETPLDILGKSPDFPPLVIVRDAAGMDLAVAYDPSGSGSAQLSTSLEAGVYAVFMVSSGPQSRGSYQLTIDAVSCPEPSPIAVGESVDGALSAGDCPRAGGAYQDAFALVVETEAVLRLDLTSQAFDAYLILRDEAGGEIASDDDGGSGFDARIERTLSAGTYVIAASSFGPGATGPYTLSVTAPPPPASAISTSEAPVIPISELQGSSPQPLPEALGSLLPTAPKVRQTAIDPSPWRGTLEITWPSTGARLGVDSDAGLLRRTWRPGPLKSGAPHRDRGGPWPE